MEKDESWQGNGQEQSQGRVMLECVGSQNFSAGDVRFIKIKLFVVLPSNSSFNLLSTMTIRCPIQGCLRFFERAEDLTRHFTALHPSQQLNTCNTNSDMSSGRTNSLRNPPLPHYDYDKHQELQSLPPAGFPEPDQQPAPQDSAEKTFKVYHPNLTGAKCDLEGNFIPPNTPPDPRVPPENPWAPFDGEVEFRISDLLYHEVEMSQGNTNKLFNIWTLSMQKHGDIGPFPNYEAMHAAIDSIPFGSAPWCCLETVPDDNLPEDAPEWKRTGYQVWYRDPDTVIANMLDNPDFADGFDPCPYVELKHDDGKRR
ncbi:hypothetical protein D9758_016692 [Tetrapyrgos nigripes]|uniref:C2H2-type domain-containing protein n=1 Tax=Tetrapyrgos nigripes TaxID=182062 RepID=A0A8H5C777_9AGAR|nr:hypothetical protein D9758_016692 [Tetrapyrgos nigripes]